MKDNITLIEISAVSGLLGALLTQALSGMFNYFSDKRKNHIEVKNMYRSKKIEIGENFYYMNGERMATIKKNIGYWKNWNDSRSELSLEFLNKEISKLKTYMEKIDEKNWKYNLVNLYFNVSLSNGAINEYNIKSKMLYLKVLDIADKMRTVREQEKEDLYGKYAVAIFDLCLHYEELYSKMEHDMNVVKTELLEEFSISFEPALRSSAISA